MIIEQLSSLLDDAAVIEPWTLTGRELREVAAAVQQTRTSLDALMSRIAGTAEDMGLPADDGGTEAAQNGTAALR